MREGTIGCLSHKSPKFYNILLLVGWTTLGTLVNFDWLIHSVECSNFSTTNLSSLGMYINLRLISIHCSIPVSLKNGAIWLSKVETWNYATVKNQGFGTWEKKLCHQFFYCQQYFQYWDKSKIYSILLYVN